MGIGIDAKCAGIHPFRNMHFLHQLQDIPSAKNINSFSPAFIPCAHLVPACDVEYTLHPLHTGSH